MQKLHPFPEADHDRILPGQQIDDLAAMAQEIGKGSFEDLTGTVEHIVPDLIAIDALPASLCVKLGQYEVAPQGFGEER